MDFFLRFYNPLIIMPAFLLSFILWRLLNSFWIKPYLAYMNLRRNGFTGPTPSFPMGNLADMKRKQKNCLNCTDLSSSSRIITHDIHSTVFPYFSRWQKSYGKVFIYWLGTEPFLYIADPEFLRRISASVAGKSWGKPSVFKSDRKPMFGTNGLVMVEGDHWLHHRRIITPAFSPSNLRAMVNLMAESATKMLDWWSEITSSGRSEIDVERHISIISGEIIAKTGFGLSYKNSKQVLQKLTDLQLKLFQSNRYVGVPLGKFLSLKQNLEARKLGKEIDALILSIITERKKSQVKSNPKDLLGSLMNDADAVGRLGKRLTASELVDECKTFFFGGLETTALLISWTLLLLAMYPQWQEQLREEIKGLFGDGEKKIIDATMLPRLKKMEWVMNEVLRLYPPAPNAQRQAREDIKLDDGNVIPKGTNIWVDLVAIHHDKALWGEDVNQFQPERFNGELYGGCDHKMGFSPFGFGGRMCIGRNFSAMEYKVVLTLTLMRFSFSVSPNYCHSPSTLLSLKPTYGVPLLVQPL